MIAVVRRIERVAVLVLLLAGAAQTVASAQGCARLHGPAGHGDPTAVSDATADAPFDAAAAHDRLPEPVSEGPSAPATACGLAALPTERDPLPDFPYATLSVARGALPPAYLLIRSVFRPPILS